MENQDEMFSNVNDEELNKEILRQQLLNTPVRKLRERIKNKKKKIIKKPKKKPKKEINVYKCPSCPKQFLKKQGLVLHKQTHSEVKAFSCDLCDYKCSVKKYISAHKKRVHREKTKYECEFCGKKFTYRSKLNNHLRVHTGEKPFKCGNCDKSFSSSYSLNTHTFIHTGEKPYKCAFCAYACRDNSTLRKHEARHMGTDYRYQCTICHKSYKQKWQLKNHVAEKHFMADVRGHICAHCDRSFKFKQALSTHMQAVHLKTLRMKCELCNVVLTNKANLSAHMLTHLDIRAYKCTFRGCRKSFKDKATLTKHTITHYPEKQHRCDICSRLFARRIRLKVHKQQHCGKSANLECDYCGACFTSKCPLGKHIKYAHSGSKQYICDICHYVAHKRQHIVLHMKYHTEHNLRHCNICKKTYKKPEYLKRHYNKVHEIHFKTSPTNLNISKIQNLKIKSEPEDSNDEDNLPLTAFHRFTNGDDKTIGSVSATTDGMSETTARNIIEKNSKHLTKLPDAIFDEFFISKVKGSNDPCRVKSVKEKCVDRKKREQAKVELKKLMNRARQKMYCRQLEETRRLYNKRMKRFCSTINKKDPLVIKFYKRKNKGTDNALHSNSEHNEKHNNKEHNKFTNDKVENEVDSENKNDLSNNNDDELEKSVLKKITKNMEIWTVIDNKCEEIDPNEVFDNDKYELGSEISTSDDKEYNKCNISNITSHNADNKTSTSDDKESNKCNISNITSHNADNKTSTSDDNESKKCNTSNITLQNTDSEINTRNNKEYNKCNIINITSHNADNKTSTSDDKESNKCNISNITSHNADNKTSTSDDKEYNKCNIINITSHNADNKTSTSDDNESKKCNTSNITLQNTDSEINTRNNKEYNKCNIINITSHNADNKTSTSDDNESKKCNTSNITLQNTDSEINTRNNKEYNKCNIINITSHNADNKTSTSDDKESNKCNIINITSHNADNKTSTSDDNESKKCNTSNITSQNTDSEINIRNNKEYNKCNISNITSQNADNKTSTSDDKEYNKCNIINITSHNAVNKTSTSDDKESNKCNISNITSHNADNKTSTSDDKEYNKCNISNITSHNADNKTSTSDDKESNKCNIINITSHNADNKTSTSDDKEYNKCNISNIASQNYDNDNEVYVNDEVVERNSDMSNKVIDHKDTNDETSQVNDHETEDKSRNELVKDNVDDEIKVNRKIMINTHQCYICFKLFSTRTELLDHCKIHFDYCSEKTLKKCPLCNHVTSVAINQHMKRKHNVTIKLPYKLKDKIATKNGSRYYYDIDDEHIKEIQIIPTVRYLNREAYVKIDEKKRKDKNEGMFERVLSKKGKEWVVEQKNVCLSDFKPLPRFKSTDYDSCDANADNVANYADRIKILSRMAKRVGVKMYYPCDVCEKVCQNMSALRLHSRKHDPNAKPYKAKVWKHKTKDKGHSESVDKKVEKPSENRYKKPHPIVNKHKCDQKLKDFYENNVRGGDVEFWQFLKIFNKMERECISDFSELEKRTDFGIHHSEKTLQKDVSSISVKVSSDKTVRKVKNSDNKDRIRVNKEKYTRVVRLSRGESEKRNLIRMKLREKYAKES